MKQPGMLRIIATNHAWEPFGTQRQQYEVKKSATCGSVRDDRWFSRGKTHTSQRKQCTLENTANSCHAIRGKRQQRLDSSQIDPSSTCGVIGDQNKVDTGFEWGGCYLESLLLTVAEAAGRGGILSLIWSRYFASENPLILCVGVCALNTIHEQASNAESMKLSVIGRSVSLSINQ